MNETMDTSHRTPDNPLRGRTQISPNLAFGVRQKIVDFVSGLPRMANFSIFRVRTRGPAIKKKSTKFLEILSGLPEEAFFFAFRVRMNNFFGYLQLHLVQYTRGSRKLEKGHWTGSN